MPIYAHYANGFCHLWSMILKGHFCHTGFAAPDEGMIFSQKNFIGCWWLYLDCFKKTMKKILLLFFLVLAAKNILVASERARSKVCHMVTMLAPPPQLSECELHIHESSPIVNLILSKWQYFCVSLYMTIFRENWYYGLLFCSCSKQEEYFGPNGIA